MKEYSYSPNLGSLLGELLGPSLKDAVREKEEKFSSSSAQSRTRLSEKGWRAHPNSQGVVDGDNEDLLHTLSSELVERGNVGRDLPAESKEERVRTELEPAFEEEESSRSETEDERRAGRSEGSRDTDDNDLSLSGESKGSAGVELLDLNGWEGGSDLWRKGKEGEMERVGGDELLGFLPFNLQAGNKFTYCSGKPGRRRRTHCESEKGVG